MAAAMQRLPVVVVLGATGSGKSKLAIDLAKRFSGEIISADSMQVYKGLDIITNKVSEEEQEICPHHMIGYVDPLQLRYKVTDFRNKALPIIDGLLKKQKLPIIVGGTHYYIEALLWHLLIDQKCVSSDEEGEEAAVVTPSDELLELRENFDDLDSRELYAKLMSVDPSYAKTLHPNNKRKIIRGLEVHSQHGVTMSEILAEQHQEDQDVSGPLRYQHNCIFWVQCQQTVLDERLDKRVDSMLERGLVAELLDFHSRYNQQRLEEHKEADYTHGIFQSIGFKEFHNYLILPEQERQSQMGETLLKEGIDSLKLVTRRYARRQITWIKNRLLRRPGQDVPPVYTVDATKPEEWDYAVLEPACHILETIMKGDVPLISPAQKEVKQSDPVVHKICDICDGQLLLTQSNWEGHLKSRKHLKRVYKKRKRQRELLQLMQSYEKKKHTEAAGGPIGAVADDSAST